MNKKQFLVNNFYEEQQNDNQNRNEINTLINKIKLSSISLETYDKEIDKLFQSKEAFESIFIKFSDKNNNDVSSLTKQILYVSTESIYKQNKINSRLSMEGIGETLSNIWNAIVKMFSKLVGKIKDIYKYVSDVSERIEVRVKSTLDKIDRFDTTIKRSDIIKNSNIAKGFSIRGNTNASTTIAILNNHTKISNNVDDYAEIVRELLKQTSDLVRELNTKTTSHASKEPGWFEKIFALKNKKYTESMKKSIALFSRNTSMNKEATPIKGSEQLFNQRYIHGLSKLVNEKEQIYEVTWEIKEDKEELIDDECSTLDKSDMISVCNKVLELNEHTRDTRKNEKILEEGLKTVENIASLASKLNAGAVNKEKATQKAAKKIEKINDNDLKTEEKIVKESISLEASYEEKKNTSIETSIKEVSSVIKNEASRVRSLLKSSANILGQLPRGNVEACKKALDYVDLSMRADREDADND